MEALENLKQAILKEYPRLSEQDDFAFECNSHLECFNRCCADVNIFLTPYDVLRMRKALGIGSGEFLDKYVLIPFDKSQRLPTPLMLMRDSEAKECHFVEAKKGCTIYANRPWPCRMYPIGLASPGETETVESKPFYFMMREEVCKGIGKSRIWTVAEWMKDQEVSEYARFGELFKAVTLHPAFSKGFNPSPQQIDMYWISLYDLDKFRKFIFETSFLSRFELSASEIKTLKSDDEALLLFGFKWVQMALFGDKTLTMRPEASQPRTASLNRVASDA